MKTTQEAVLMTFDEQGLPYSIVWKNGHIQYFRLKEMSLADHEELLEVNKQI